MNIHTCDVKSSQHVAELFCKLPWMRPWRVVTLWSGSAVECVTVPSGSRFVHDCLPVAMYLTPISQLSKAFCVTMRLQRGRGGIGGAPPTLRHACDPWNVAACKLIRCLLAPCLLLLELDGQRARDACRRAMPKVRGAARELLPLLDSLRTATLFNLLQKY